jgi:hypothetical protein
LGKGEFEDVTFQSGLIHEQRFVSWGVGLVDLDNDGFPDIFLVTGQVYPELEAKYPRYPRRRPRLVSAIWEMEPFKNSTRKDTSASFASCQSLLRFRRFRQ